MLCEGVWFFYKISDLGTRSRPFNGAVSALAAMVGGMVFDYATPGQPGAAKFTCPLCDPPLAEQVSEEHLTLVIKAVEGGL